MRRRDMGGSTAWGLAVQVCNPVVHVTAAALPLGHNHDPGGWPLNIRKCSACVPPKRSVPCADDREALPSRLLPAPACAQSLASLITFRLIPSDLNNTVYHVLAQAIADGHSFGREL